MFSRTGFYSFHYHFNIYSSLCCGRQHIKKQRHYFANKGTSSQSYGFSSSHVWIWELDYKESWAPKNWCFWTVVWEKAFESPLDCKEIQPFHPKGWILKSWVFIGRTDVEAETPILWPSDAKSWLIWKDLDAGKKDENVGWHQWLNGQGFGWIPGVGDGQGGLACCGSWGRRVGHDWVTDLNWFLDYSDTLMKLLPYRYQWLCHNFIVYSTWLGLCFFRLPW